MDFKEDFVPKRERFEALVLGLNAFLFLMILFSLVVDKFMFWLLSIVLKLMNFTRNTKSKGK